MTPSGLSPERWRKIDEVFQAAMELPPEERAAFLDRNCAGDAELRAEVQELLGSSGGAGSFIDQAIRREAGQLEAAVEATPGRRLGPYRVVRSLGHGGMGAVYLAVRDDDQFRKEVAVKLLRGGLESEEVVARFRDERQILATLEHPGIVRLLDGGGTEDGLPFLVMEHVEGVPITEYCERHGLPVRERLLLFRQVCAAVQYAHQRLVVHRDIKPGNILVGADGTPKLLDFGIAKLLGGGAREAQTRTGMHVLTPEYGSPEQARGEPVSTATDVYSLGAVLYEMLTGVRAHRFDDESAVGMLRTICEVDPPRPSTVAPPDRRRALQGDVDNIVLKALHKEPGLRYASVEQLSHDLRRNLEGLPVTARAGTWGYRAGKFVRRNRTAVALASLTLVALIAGLLGTISQARRASAQAARADQEARSAGAQRDFALRQLSRAEAINDLNNFVLSDAHKGGHRFTVDELLARAQRSIERQQGVAGEDRVELLLAIGYQYQSLDEHGKAREILARAYELAGTSSDRATRAKAACALASAVGQAGERERAEELLRRADDDLPNEPQFALHRVFCLEMGSVVAGERGDARVAIQRSEAAQRVLKESRFDAALMDLRISVALAMAYGVAGRWREAAHYYETAHGRLASLGRDDTRMAGTILNNWANALLALGQPLQAERMFRRVIETGSATAEGATPVRLLNLARSLRDLDRQDEAAHYAELAYTRAQQMGHQVAVDQSLFVRASIYLQQGKLQQADRVLAEVEPRLKRLPPGHVLFAVFASERAQLAQARGDSASAMAAADRAVAITEASMQPAVYLRRFLARRSELAFQMGRMDQATADAEAALRLELEGGPAGTFSNHRGLCYLALGQALQGQGKTDQARVAFASAVEQLKPSLGEQHPATRSALRLAASASSGRAR